MNILQVAHQANGSGVNSTNISPTRSLNAAKFTRKSHHGGLTESERVKEQP